MAPGAIRVVIAWRMRSAGIAISLALGLALTAACTPDVKGVEVAAIDLVPAGADMVIGMTLAPVRGSALSAPLWGAMQSDPDIAGIARAMETCDVALDNLTAMLASTVEGAELLIVMEAPGIGNEDKMKCVEKEGTPAGEDPGVLRFETHGDIRRAPQEGGGWLIILNKNAIAVVDTTWEVEVFNRIANESARAKDGPLAGVLGRVDPKQHLWAALTFSEAERADFGDLNGADGLTDILVNVDLSTGMAVTANMGFDKAANASSFTEAFPPLLTMSKGELVAIGLPPEAVDSVKLNAEGPSVRAVMTVSAEELPGLISLIVSLAE